MRRIAVIVLVVASLPVPAHAAPPLNDQWWGATPITLPFDGEVSFAGANREWNDNYGDCVPEDESPETPFSARYGDVWFRFTIGGEGYRPVLAVAESPASTTMLNVWETRNGAPYSWWGCDRWVRQADGLPATMQVWLDPGEYLATVAGCTNCEGSTTARFRLWDVPPEADVAVERVTVTRPPTATPAGDLPPSPVTRHIDATFTNSGGSTARSFWGITACHRHSDEGYDYCIPVADGMTPPLEAGASFEVTTEWNAAESGSIGDFEICAWVDQFDHIDPEWRNDRLRAKTWVVIGNFGNSESWVTALTGGFTGCG